MLRLSKKVEYSIMAILHLDAMGHGRVWPAREIATACHIPEELLGRILHRLSRGGLLASVQGVKGGFRLKRSLDSVTLSDVIEIVDGPVRLTCCQTNEKQCGQWSVCSIRRPVQRVQRDLIHYMKNLPLSVFRIGGRRGAMRRRRNHQWRKR